MFGPGGSFFVWVGGMNGGRDERTDCQRDGGQGWGRFGGLRRGPPPLSAGGGVGGAGGRGGVSLWGAGRGVASALWWMRCGGSVASALWWMQWNEVLAVFVEGFLLTFAGGVVILKVHIWEHSGPFGYLIPIWLVV